MPVHAIDAVLEIFTWVGLGGALFLGVAALIVRLADGSWQPVQVVITHDPDGSVARWFSPDGGVGAARLTIEQEARLAGRDAADVFARVGRTDRVRLIRTSPLGRFLTWLAVGFAALAALAAIGSLVLLFVSRS